MAYNLGTAFMDFTSGVIEADKNLDIVAIRIRSKFRDNFNYLEFQVSYFKHFYFDGNLVDVEISESHMKEFLINEKQNLENLAQEFKKKVIKN